MVVTHVKRRVLALRFICRSILTPAVIGSTVYYLASRFGLGYKPLLVLCGIIVGWPLKFSLGITYGAWNRARRARAVGTVNAPSESRWNLLSEIDVMRELQELNKNGFVGEWFAAQYEKAGSGTVGSSLMGTYFISTADPGNVKAILATEFNNFEKGTFDREAMESVLGEGIFNSNGDIWKMHRSITRPFFVKDRVRDFEIFDKHALKAIDKMKRRFNEGYALNFEDMIYRFTFDSAGEFLFETNFQTLDSELLYPRAGPHSGNQASARDMTREEAFFHAIIGAQMVMSERLYMGPLWLVAEFFKDKTEPHMEVISGFLNPILEEGIAKHAAKTEVELKDREGETLLDSLLQETSDRNVLRDGILNTLVAGGGTTASTLTFVVFLLILHPEVLQRLRGEILEVVGPTEQPTYEHVRDMKYLRAVLNETLRLYPPVPVNGRAAINETTLPEGGKDGKPIHVPAGALVAFTPVIMHRRKDLWGPDADEFDPDRFIDDRVKKYLVANPFIFLPFNAGPRICIGQQFAYNEISFFLVRLLQNFDKITLDMDAQPQRTTSLLEWKTKRREVERDLLAVHLGLSTKDGLWVRMSEAPAPE